MAATLGALALFGASACRSATANAASTSVSGVWVSVNPNTVSAGSAVTVRASCADDTNPATISSRAFGTTTVQPLDGVLSTSVVIPSDTRGGTFDVSLTCRTGSKASTTLTVLNGQAAAPAGRSSMGPHTGGGFLANGADAADRMTSGPFIWIAVGLASIVAAIVINVRNRRAARRLSRR